MFLSGIPGKKHFCVACASFKLIRKAAKKAIDPKTTGKLNLQPWVSFCAVMLLDLTSKIFIKRNTR